MFRSTLLICGFSLAATGCGTPLDRSQRAEAVDYCADADPYEFRSIFDFSGNDPGWFLFGDPTPGGAPKTEIPVRADGGLLEPADDIVVTDLEEPGRCGDTRVLVLEAYGHNFWGAGFGDWVHNGAGSRADGTGYDGISLWVKSAPNRDKSFVLNVDDGRTIVLPPETADGSLLATNNSEQDLDGDGFIGPGDIAPDTQCRLPPPEEFGEASCYNGGVDPPSNATRVPAPDECGNSFHVVINMTEQWQFVLIPWSDLVQWPCPNRLEGGINPGDIAKLQIEFEQGTHYEVSIDNIAFYRRRASSGD